MPAPKPATSFYDEPAARLLKLSHSRVYERLEELPWTQDSITSTESDAIEWVYWLSTRSWRAPITLLDLSWTQDSITETKRDVIEWLYWLAEEDRERVAEAIAKPFLETVEAEDVETIREMTGGDSESYLGKLNEDYPAVAGQLQGLAWPQPPFTESERDAIRGLYWLAGEDQGAAVAVAAMPWVQDGITQAERTAIHSIYGLSRREKSLGATVISLPWVQDYITLTESRTVQRLDWLAYDDKEATAAVVAMPWVQDDITLNESQTIQYLDWLAYNDKEAVAALLAMPWVQDDNTLTESRTIQYLAGLADDDKKAVAAVLAMPWVQDGITETEADALREFRQIAHNSEASTTALAAAPWIQDGITETEADVLDNLNGISGRNADTAATLIAKPWIQDGITDVEVNVLDDLNGISGRNADAAAALIAMPFLNSIEDRDMLALMSLNNIAARNAGDFSELMSHSRIKDGITDEDTKIVAVLGQATYSNAPESAEVLLADTGVYIQERLIELPHTGETLLAVIGVQDPDTRSMDYFEHAVRTIERFMGEPYPIDYLAMLYYHNKSNNANNNFTHLLFMGEDDELHREAHPGVIAHEIAHWYWSGSGDYGYQYRKWITEGTAEFLRVISEHERVGRPLEPTQWPCGFFEKISELEKANPSREFIPGVSTPRECYYSLGERFFLGLYLALGEETFRPAFRTLYLRYQQDNPGDGCGRPPLNICRVEAVFKEGASAEVVRKIDEVIAHWYGPRP